MSIELLMGNEAIALGLVEEGCRVVTAYPGTPSSEILAGVVKFKERLAWQVYTEWSINEKVAFEVAMAASWAGLRAAVTMKQVGLNVASDPLFSAAYTGVEAGFLVIPADDPGPHSSQTEQDSRLMALAAKIPVLDPSTPAEARLMVAKALAVSERYRLPVVLRPTTRLCHALQPLETKSNGAAEALPARRRFRKEPQRWAATPKFRYLLHKSLAEKLAQIEAEFADCDLNYEVPGEPGSRLGVIASGVAFHTVQQVLAEMGISLPLFKVGAPFPLPRRRLHSFVERFAAVLVVEESDACIELQLPNRQTVRGRLDGTVPAAGELTPDVVYDTIAGVLRQQGYDPRPAAEDRALEEAIANLSLPVRRPRLCPGCSHRSAFYVMKRAFGPQAIYPSDIGCYTLGINLRAVDTCVDMGAAITLANGFYQANRVLEDDRQIVATIGDSTFLHAGIPALINAVHTGARFVLLILDNHTTAMTGMQPTAQSEVLADGTQAARRIPILELVRACGVEFVSVADPYDQQTFDAVLRQAQEYAARPDGGVAVVIADRPCVLYEPSSVREHPRPVVVTAQCDGCRYCIEAFECPALVLRPDGGRVDIDYSICVECGQCIDACYKGFIIPRL